MYEYKAHIISIYDGDTVTAKVDLGFNFSFENNFRLYGINAPEVRGDEREKGLLSRDYLRSLILDKEVIIKTYKDKTEKYGRYLATIFLKNGEELININDLLVKDGHAVYKEY